MLLVGIQIYNLYIARIKNQRNDIYLLFYTLLASLPLLVDILFVYNSLGSLCLFLLSGNSSLVGGFYGTLKQKIPHVFRLGIPPTSLYRSTIKYYRTNRNICG